MGDLVGQAVEGTLYYVGPSEFERVRAIRGNAIGRAALFADMCRLNALYMIARAGSGHIGSSFSSLDIVSWLMLEELSSADAAGGTSDTYFSSKGHDAPGYYAALIGMGKLPFDLIHKLRRIGGLPGHPDIGTPGIAANTGSLGMGISKAKGMVFANRHLGRSGRVFVMTGDGELQEGQFWESLISAVNYGCHEITVIVDHNKLQSDTFVRNVSDLGDLEAKFRAFGWYVDRCDGHDFSALRDALGRADKETKRPKIIIADTVKGCGVSFMEHTSLDSDVAMYRFHSGAPDANSYQRASQELIERINSKLRSSGLTEIKLETSTRDAAVAVSDRAQRLVQAYSRALIAEAEQNPNLVALDADLVLDTGLIPFREKFPTRFYECGIAEQDMVSIAGAMALKGLLPVVHSFSCFLSTRPNEQIYNNATERTKIIYVGSLAGLIPGGPGHSHQSVRDLAALGSIPGLITIAPGNEQEVAMALDYAANRSKESVYLRLESIPVDLSFRLPEGYCLEMGRGAVLCEGTRIAIFGYGPTLLNSAYRAASSLRASKGVAIKVVNLPWINRVDTAWLRDAVLGTDIVLTLDNHYPMGGLGDTVAAACSGNVDLRRVVVRKLGVQTIPACGTNDEVLRDHGLDERSLVAAITALL